MISAQNHEVSMLRSVLHGRNYHWHGKYQESDVLKVYNIDTEKRTIIDRGSCRNAGFFYFS